MHGEGDFAEADRQAARNFVAAGQDLRQVIYLGGLLPDASGSHPVSEHLESRAEVGRILREGLPTTELRAGPIIGGGSASFEMVRYLTERLPAMIAPRWIMNDVQPIGIRDALAYLVAALGRDDSLGVVDIGTDPLTFRGMMTEYARIRGLPRIIAPVPVLAPKLAGLWVGLVTPIPNRLALPLVEGVVRPVLADTERAQRLFPEIEPMTYGEAVELAIARTDAGEVVTRWSLSGDTTDPEVRLIDQEGVIREVRTRLVDAPQKAVFEAFSSLGGERGWRVWGGCGHSAGCWTRWSAAPGCGAVGANPSVSIPAKHSTSGGSRSTAPITCSASERR